MLKTERRVGGLPQLRWFGGQRSWQGTRRVAVARRAENGAASEREAAARAVHLLLDLALACWSTRLEGSHAEPLASHLRSCFAARSRLLAQLSRPYTPPPPLILTASTPPPPPVMTKPPATPFPISYTSTLDGYAVSDSVGLITAQASDPLPAETPLKQGVSAEALEALRARALVEFVKEGRKENAYGALEVDFRVCVEVVGVGVDFVDRLL